MHALGEMKGQVSLLAAAVFCSPLVGSQADRVDLPHIVFAPVGSGHVTQAPCRRSSEVERVPAYRNSLA